MNQKQLEKYKNDMLDELGSEYCIYGKSHAVREICATIKKIARVDSTVLVLGESGTGKEMVANAIHLNSKRAKGPFIKVNCAALNDNLLESELFGHARGSFTGALSDKVGKFEAADGGTIFLDEIGDVSTQMQSKLLRVLQERQFERVGEVKTRSCDVRIIAATNRDLMRMIDEKKFRLDLYYRLNVVSIYLPSLKERRDDIPGLANYFIHKFNERENAGIKGISREAVDTLKKHAWPGNVRELENVIEQACVMAGGETIETVSLPSTGTVSGMQQFISLSDGHIQRSESNSFSGLSGRRIIRGATSAEREPSDEADAGITLRLPCTLEEAETIIIKKTLEISRNNKTHAAEMLGISLRSLQMRLKKIG
ncbi:MAG TPA: sigma-54 dependent transcriptional regulator [Candidatus Wallbacteria bacterium]|nr:sigma-54 dependent transcriptional regulator [Candidatus Wallbacteria bacterium]